MASPEIDALYDEICPLAERFAKAGFSFYLVGGIVRNHLAGSSVDLDDRVGFVDLDDRVGFVDLDDRVGFVDLDDRVGFVDLDDIDITTDAQPAEIKALVTDWFEALWTQGERFGTIGGRRGSRVFEITTHRAESYAPDSRKPEVVFSTALIDDLSRRDFTVNAMAWTVPERELIDPFDGQSDLVAKRLRTPLDPEVSFTDDPLRMLRAARFLTRFDLEADAALLAAVERLAGRAGDRLGRTGARRIA